MTEIYEFKIKGILPEEISWSLVSLGCQVTEENKFNSKVIFFGNKKEANKLLRNLSSFAKTGLLKKLPSQNWTQQCPEVMKNLKIGKFKIIFHSSLERTKINNKQNEIWLSPNQAWGTGHHETTSMVLGFLQNKKIFQNKAKSILDFGTGSGILAIAAAKIFNTKITAIDIDNNILKEAKSHARTNKVKINFLLPTTKNNFKDKFDLIIANVYSDVLIKNESFFKKSSHKNCKLILSGINNKQSQSVIKAFSKNWELKWHKNKKDWNSFYFCKRTMASG